MLTAVKLNLSLPNQLAWEDISSPVIANGFCNATFISFPCASAKFLAKPVSPLAVNDVCDNALSQVDQLVELVNGCTKSPKDAIVTPVSYTHLTLPTIYSV